MCCRPVRFGVESPKTVLHLFCLLYLIVSRAVGSYLIYPRTVGFGEVLVGVISDQVAWSASTYCRGYYLSSLLGEEREIPPEIFSGTIKTTPSRILNRR